MGACFTAMATIPFTVPLVRRPPECLMPRVGTTLADLSPHHLVLCIVRVFEELYQ